jgi:hypothetical protein
MQSQQLCDAEGAITIQLLRQRGQRSTFGADTVVNLVFLKDRRESALVRGKARSSTR